MFWKKLIHQLLKKVFPPKTQTGKGVYFIIFRKRFKRIRRLLLF